MSVDEIIAKLPNEITERSLTGWFIGPDGKHWSALEVAGWNKCLTVVLLALKEGAE